MAALLACLVGSAKFAPVAPVAELDNTTFDSRSASEVVTYSTQSPTYLETDSTTTLSQSTSEADWQSEAYSTPSQYDVDIATTGPNHHRIDPDRSRWNHANYVLSETEYQQLLQRLQREAEESVMGNPGNYVDRDVSLDEIIRLIEISEAMNQTDAPAAGIQTISDLERSSTNHVHTEFSGSTPSPQAITQTARECAICLETIESYDRLLELKCNHEFHHNCIVYWYLNVSILDL